MKTLFAFILASIAGGAFAANTVEIAQTGVPLDVAKTLSVTDTSNACGVVPVEMVYEDSKGVRHTVTYSVLGSGCSGD